MNEELSRTRTPAQIEAGVVLQERGFVHEDDRYRGTLDCGDHGHLSVSIQIPASFPDELLNVYLVDELPVRIPHLESNHKLCIGQDVLIDTDRVLDVVQECLARATSVICDGLEGKNDADWLDELQAYWHGAEERFGSILRSDSNARPVFLGRIRDGCTFKNRSRIHRLLADSEKSASAWANNVGVVFDQSTSAYYMPLEVCPDVGKLLNEKSNGAVRALLRKAAGRQAVRRYLEWVSKNTLPAVLVVGLPGREAIGRVLAGLWFKGVDQADGFRKGRVHPLVQIRMNDGEPAERVKVVRLDPEYLNARTAGIESLDGRSVAVVGCGSVGSHIAVQLGAFGVAELQLVDPEPLLAENVNRHLCGTEFIGLSKTEAVQRVVQRRFPSVRCVSVPKRCDESGEDVESALLADLVVLATGNETIQLRMDALLKKPRLHVWVEPLGLGGHVAAIGTGETHGCFRCLFDRREGLGFVNLASFAEQGQMFHRRFGGCAGTFSPFSCLDAERTAIEASRLAREVLLGQLTQSTLTSWMGSAKDFEAAGFRLSTRGRQFSRGSTARMRIGRLACPRA